MGVINDTKGKLAEKRKEYLEEIPDSYGNRVSNNVQRKLGAVGIEVYQAYLNQLKDLYLPIDMSKRSFNTENRIRFFDITKWVTDSKEQSIDKLVNVYHVLSDADCNIALIYHRTKNN